MFTLPPLPYPYHAIAPVISAQTMQLHHDVHHAKYVQACNELAPQVGVPSYDLAHVARWIAAGSLPMTEDGQRFRENFGQHLNHTLFWNTLCPPGSPQPPPTPHLMQLARASNDEFTNINQLLDKVLQVGSSLFGSGWVWVARTGPAVPTLRVLPFPNGENPAFRGMTPLFGIDLWEHAYYLDYAADRTNYLRQVLYNALNWNTINHRAYDSTANGAM